MQSGSKTPAPVSQLRIGGEFVGNLPAENQGFPVSLLPLVQLCQGQQALPVCVALFFGVAQNADEQSLRLFQASGLDVRGDSGEIGARIIFRYRFSPNRDVICSECGLPLFSI